MKTRIICALAICFAGVASAECPRTVISSVTGLGGASPFRIRVELLEELHTGVSSVPKASIQIRLPKSGTEVSGGEIVESANVVTDFALPRIVIEFRDGFILPMDETRIEITFKRLALKCGTVAEAKAGGLILSAQKAFDQAKQNLESAVAVGTATGERNLFAGFAAVKGDGGNSAGAADLVINQPFYGSGLKSGTLFDNALVNLLVKKNSGANADLRAMHTGLTLSKVLHWGAARRLRTKAAGKERDARVLLNRGGWCRGIVIDEMFRLEGDAANFKTVNWVSDTQFVLPSVAKRMDSRGSYFHFRMLAGAELGRNLAQPDPKTPAAPAMDYIRRTKAGGDLTLRWGTAGDDAQKFAVELDLHYVNRWLHSAEPVLRNVVREGNVVREIVTIEKGSRPFRQARLKLWLFGNDKIRYGINLSYAYGSLPPSFAEVKAFQFGFVFETTDDESDGGPVK